MITLAMQIQAIGDLMYGHPPSLSRDQLDENFQWLYDLVTEDPNNAYQALAHLKLSSDDPKLPEIIDRIMAVEPGHRPHYKSLAEIAPTLPDITWLWDGWIPRGYITMLAAWPGVGKTYIALDLAKRVIHSQEAPDGQPLHTRHPTVIYVDAEDFLPAVAKRAQVWGMDMNQFFPIERPPRDLIDMNKPEYQDLLINMAYQLKPDLIVVDSLSSVNSRGENNVEDLREVLGFFTEIPKAFDCGFILVHHLRKPGKSLNNAVSMHDLRGSGHLTAMARTILGVDVLNVDEDPNGPRVLKHLKNNLSKYAPQLAVRFQKTHDPDVAQLGYSSLNLILNPEKPKHEQAADWLKQALQDGPRAFADLKDALQRELDIDCSALQRARKHLGTLIVDTTGPKKKGNKWALNPEFS